MWLKTTPTISLLGPLLGVALAAAAVSAAAAPRPYRPTAEPDVAAMHARQMRIQQAVDERRTLRRAGDELARVRRVELRMRGRNGGRLTPAEVRGLNAMLADIERAYPIRRPH